MTPKRLTSQVISHPVHKVARIVLHKHPWQAHKRPWLLRAPNLLSPHRRVEDLRAHRLDALCASTTIRHLLISPQLPRENAPDWSNGKRLLTMVISRHQPRILISRLTLDRTLKNWPRESCQNPATFLGMEIRTHISGHSMGI